MGNPLTELVRRATFLDIIEHSKEADAFLQTVEDENKRFIYAMGNLARNASRIMLRLAGDLGAGIVIYYGASMEPDHLGKYVALGSAGMSGLYALDYLIYDYLAPNFLKKDDH